MRSSSSPGESVPQCGTPTAGEAGRMWGALASVDVPALLAPLHAPSAGELLADRIVTAIALGEFVPGQRLPAERELASLLGTSRTIVRDALARVAAAGLVEIRRGRAGGAYVCRSWAETTAQSVRATLSPRWTDLEHLFDLRRLVEALVARTAAERRDERDVVDIEQALEAYEQAPDLAAAQSADVRLHHAVARAAKNPRLLALRQQLLSEVSFGFAVEPFTDDVYDRALPQHRALVRAISLSGSTINGTISTGSTENLWAPEWLGSSRLLMYGEFANADLYYDLGASTAHPWIAPDPNDFSDNAFEYPIVAGGRLATTGWGATGDRAVRLRTTNGAPPALPTFRCDIYTASNDTVALVPRVAPDGGAVTWVEEDQSTAVDNIYISPIGNIGSGDCSSLHRQLFVAGGSDPFWGPAGMTVPAGTSLSVNDVSVTEGNSGTKAAAFTITRSGSTTGTSTVTYATANGTATAGSDYTAVGPTTVTFAAGETSKTVSVSVLGDTTVEPNETFSLMLSSPTGATLSDSSGTATIANDDGTPTAGPATFLSVNDVSRTEGASGSGAATFTITRYGSTAGTSSVRYATSNGTALAGSDYTAVTSTTVTFSAGQTSKTVSVAVLGGTVPEGDETFSLGLSSPVGAVVADPSGVATIVNDDTPAYLRVNDVSVTEGNSGTKLVTFTVTRSGSTAVSSVRYATSNGTALAGSDYTAVPSTAVTFTAGQTTKTVTVTVLGDTTVEPNETFSLVLSSPVGATLSDSTGVATVLNDD